MDAGSGRSGASNGPEVGSGAATKSAVERKARGIRTQPTRSSSRLWNKFYLPFQVFNNDLLREKILGYAVLSGNYKENSKTACTLRLVEKSWNEVIIKVIYKKQEPLFFLNTASTSDDFADDDNGNLKRFYATFTSSTLINGCIPPFRLEINNFLTPKLALELSNLLTRCGEGLVQLYMSMTQTGNIFKSGFPKWPLVHLRKVDITLFVSRPRNVNSDYSTVDLHLLKVILRDATAITDFLLNVRPFDPSVNFEITGPSVFESIVLPASITRMSLRGHMRSKDFETLAGKAILPHLRSLTLCVWDNTVLVDGLFFRLLDNFRTSLKTLSIGGILCVLQDAASIRFPVMEKLEHLSVNSSKVEVDSGLHSLERSIQKLHTLHLCAITSSALHKWTCYSKLVSVTTLHFHLAHANHIDQPNFIYGLTMETMQSVNFAFPNVRKLELVFSGTDTSGLTYIFQEMTQLTELKLFWYGKTPEVNLDLWDAVLTGVPLETVARIRDSPDLWGRNEEQLGSIKNLQELTSLSLSHNRPVLRTVIDFQGNPTALFISDMTFRLALLQMTKLKKLSLYGRFKASAEMTREWRDQGRLLEYPESQK